jgi:hypothetical protein
MPMTHRPMLAALAASALLASCASETVGPEPRDDSLDLTIPAYGALPDGVDLDANFEALFCPDDPVVTLELALIDRVRDALANDGGTYDEGSNPFMIRYAVYNLRNADIVEHLIAAHDEGVDVQVLMETDQLDPARDWNWADEALIDAGFENFEDHRTMDEDDRITADLVGIDDPSGLMHLKSRLYSTPLHTTLLTGSMNPGDNAVHNDETLHLINDERIVQRYEGIYDAVLADDGLHNSWDEGEAVNVLFTPAASGERAVSKLMQWVSEEDEQILLMVYSLRDLTAPGHSDSLVDVLSDKAAAGVPVYIISDRKQTDDYWDTTEDELRDAGIHFWEVRNTTTEYTAMHHKVAVLGRTDVRVITDAGNWSKAAMGSSSSVASNVESVLFLDTEALDAGRTGRRYLAQWMRVLQRYAVQGEPDGEPDFDYVRALLTEGDGWPMQPVSFTAYDAWTEWGENVRVVGSTLELGHWGMVGPGVPLWTDEFNYPTWFTGAPVELAVGTPFEWKLVADYEGSDNLRWEAGDNRGDFAGPPVLVATDKLELEGTWR